MHDKLYYEIALSQMFMVGPRSARTLLEHFGSAEAIFAEKPEIMRSIGSVGTYLADESYRQEALRRADREMEFIAKNNITATAITDTDYPVRLKQCPDSPIVLYKTGNCNLDAKKTLAVVGTRKITPYGRQLTESLLKSLAESNSDVLIISGLAYGIDITSHRAALQNGLTTVGVVAHGLDIIYPSQHTRIAAQMCLEGGAIVTEYPSHTRPEAHNFIQRNRIIAGLSDVVVVVESASRGGSLITANIANEYNRDVMAFPGRIGDESSAGCNRLIRDHKAEIITSADDLINLLGWNTATPQAQQQSLFDTLTTEQQTIVSLLQTEPLHINVISTRTSMTIQRTSALLTEMCFDDIVQQLPGDVYALRKI